MPASARGPRPGRIRRTRTMPGPMTRSTVLGAGLLLLLATAAPASAQEASPCPARAAASTDSTAREPDLVVSASARIRELRFESAPRAGIELTGCPSLDSVRVERSGLPRPVQPGTTYRDVSVGVEATGHLRVRCLLPALAADTSAAGRALAELCDPAAADTLGPPGSRRR